jgi:hypothetical protein
MTLLIWREVPAKSVSLSVIEKAPSFLENGRMNASTRLTAAPFIQVLVSRQRSQGFNDGI